MKKKIDFGTDPLPKQKTSKCWIKVKFYKATAINWNETRRTSSVTILTVNEWRTELILEQN